MTLSFKTLRDANAFRQREWDTDNVIDLAYRGNELAVEVGEACNVIKKLERERHGIRGSRATLDDLAQELADVIICADLIAHAAGIDLGKAVAEKFNATSEKVGLATIIMLPGVDYQAKAETEQQHLRDADNFGAPVSDHYQVGVTVPLKALRGWQYEVIDGVMTGPTPEWEARAKAFREDIRAKHGNDIEPEATLKMLERWTSEALPANEQGQIPFARAILESAEDALRFLLAAKDQPLTCDQCGASPVVTNLDNENLCKPCADKWVQAKGQAAAEREAEGGDQ